LAASAQDGATGNDCAKEQAVITARTRNGNETMPALVRGRRRGSFGPQLEATSSFMDLQHRL
jgi:hypothetical protein